MLFIAQGFGLGRVAVAPGTFGSVLGLVWFWVLLQPGRLWVLVAGTVAGLGLSVWLCGVAEKTLGQKDPGSVVLDEITAIPVCFFSWTAIWLAQTGRLPSPGQLLAQGHWLITLAIFLAFRFFDVLKPWPVRQSQVLPGGWGITIDDLLAGIYVSLVVLLIHLGRRLLAG
jgi:phosphatidylglycerophosphatase A